MSKLTPTTLPSVSSPIGSATTHAAGKLAVGTSEVSMYPSDSTGIINVTSSGAPSGGTTRADPGGLTNKVVHVPLAGSPVL